MKLYLAQEFNVLLARFFMHIRKKDGGVYEPSTLTAFQRSIQRYLNDRGSSVNILKDQEFAKSRETLAARKCELVTEHAKGNHPQATREITEAERKSLPTKICQLCTGIHGLYLMFL